MEALVPGKEADGKISTKSVELVLPPPRPKIKRKEINFGHHHARLIGISYNADRKKKVCCQSSGHARMME